MTIEQIKKYLRIDFETDDQFIEQLITVSENYIDSCCGVAYKAQPQLQNLAQLVQLKIISNLYENRDTNAENTKQDITVTTIFELLSNC